jgi:hypothetical protein
MSRFSRSRFMGPAAVLLLTIAGQGHHQRLAQRGLLPQPAGRLVAVHAGPADVQQHDLGGRAPCRGECRRAILGDLYLVPLQAQQHGEAVSRIRVVVHHQDAAGRRRGAMAIGLFRSAWRGPRFGHQGQAHDKLAALVRPGPEGVLLGKIGLLVGAWHFVFVF